MNIPNDLKYTNDHEWVRVDGDVATIGITDYAQGELGDIVYIELPEVGREVSKGDPVVTVEAVKTVADVYSPISGEVVEVNESLEESAEIVNKDPYGDGWMVKIRVASPEELDELLSAEDYKKLI